MIDRAFAQRFAEAWIDAWNAHDLDRILAHYTEDSVMSSPVIVSLTGEASGQLRGKARVGGRSGAILI
jgi:ketosteroid isomerase-like protein